MRLGKSILSIRKSKEMSQEQFGAMFHVTRQTVSNWENEKSYPDLQTLIEISDTFDISLDRLIKKDDRIAKVIDKERKSAKTSKIIICILVAALVFVGIGVKLLLNSVEPTPNEQRNLSYTSATVWLNLPKATPSRAIVRTFDQDEFEHYSERKLAQIRGEIGGAIEGDIPCMNKDDVTRLVFQDSALENVLPDREPHIVIKQYSNVSALPKYDESYTGEIKELNIDLQKDREGYTYSLKNYKPTDESDINVCMIEIYYTVDGEAFVSASAFYLQ